MGTWILNREKLEITWTEPSHNIKISQDFRSKL